MLAFLHDEKKQRGLLALVLAGNLCLLGARYALTRSFTAGDSALYYMILRSLAIDRNLDFSDEYRHFHEQRSPYTGHLKIPTIPERDPETGRLPNSKPIGFAIPLMPFFLLAHTLSFLVRAPTDGYGALYQLATALGSLLFAYLALLLLLAWGKRDFPPEVAFLAVLTLWLATPLVYYMTIEPLMSHCLSVAMVTFFLWKWRHGRSFVSFLILGVIGGLMSVVRYQDMLFLALPILDESLRPGGWKKCVVLAAGASPFLALQMAANQILCGSPLRTGYTSGVRVVFPSAALPGNLMYNLFDWHAGLFTLTPVFALSLVGLIALARKEAWGGWLLFGFLLQLVFISSLEPRDQNGASFGNRLLLDCLPLFTFGLMEWISARRFGRAVLFCASLVAANGALAALYCARLLPDPYLG